MGSTRDKIEADLAERIDAAEEAGRSALHELRAELAALADKARALREDCKRLTALKDEAEKIESAIRTAVSGVAPQWRKPDAENGEYVNGELVAQVIATRNGVA